ncbi:hypothetical protein [Bosea lathyri]|uniref:Uncharacterized protein n=1 Tax=Bosea lathyri TaxID=1036778 RepID=A0A1H6BUL3_9HYPH|nr:hypothetical protein [Bosea lathyri]SEG64322.1 hypothetical protein SAMN04488115_10885 [Bosea lathyri]
MAAEKKPIKNYLVRETTGITHKIPSTQMVKSEGELTFYLESELVAVFAAGQWVSCALFIDEKAKVDG